MNHFRLFLALILTCTLATTALAQDKATLILKESKEKFSSLRDFSASFKYGINSIEQRVRPIQKTGSIKYKAGKYAVVMDDQELYCDGATQWIFLPKDNEVTILDYDPAEGISVESIFKIYEASSKPRYDGEEAVNGVACYKIYLAITDKSVEYNQAYLWVNKTTKMIAKAVLIDRNQTRTTLEFNELKLNVGYGEDSFRFNAAKHPGVVTYDER